MVFRRHKALWQGLCLLIFVGITFKYSYSYYKNNERKLKAANIRHHELLEERNKFSRELDIVTESRDALEVSIRTKTQQFAEKMKGWDDERNSLQNEANKAKANFDALDSEYRMLKAKADELQMEYDHMKKNFDRLKEDHTKLDTEHRSNFEELKQKDEKIISALQKQVEHYQKQEHSLQIKVQDQQETITQYQVLIRKLQQKLSNKVEKGGQEETNKVSEVKDSQKAPKVAEHEGKRSKLRRRRAVKELNPVYKAEKVLKNSHDSHDALHDRNVALKQSLQNLGRVGEVKHEEKVSKNEFDVNDNIADALGGRHKDSDDLKDKNIDNIEVFNNDGKAEHNLNLDEQPKLESREVQDQLGERAVERKRSDEDGETNNDEKSDDEEMAIQDNEENVVDEDDEMLDQPENLLNRGAEEQDREQNMKE